MAFCIKNSISDLEFNDSEIFGCKSEKSNLTLYIKHLNVKRNTVENSSDFDMEIDVAKLTFFNLSFVSLKLGDTWAPDNNGVMQCTKKGKKFSGIRGAKKFIKEISNSFCLSKFVTSKIPDITNGTDVFSHELSCHGCHEPYFDVVLLSDSFTIEWDRYRQKAWYEYTKQFSEPVLVKSSGIDQTIEANIISRFNDDGDVISSSVGINIDNDRLWGMGSTKEYAILNLIKQLPHTIKLKSCITCRHGNFCPYGDNEDEIFCLKDIIPTQKTDILFYTSDPAECDKRLRRLLSVCDDYKPMEKDFYTYNDYHTHLFK